MTRTRVADEIKNGGPWTTAIGDIGYDAKGDITRLDYVMYTLGKGDDGKYAYSEMGTATPNTCTASACAAGTQCCRNGQCSTSCK